MAEFFGTGTAGRSEVEHALLRASFDQDPIARGVMDASGRFLLVNSAICEQFGVSREVLLSTPLSELVAPERPAAPAVSQHALERDKEPLDGRSANEAPQWSVSAPVMPTHFHSSAEVAGWVQRVLDGSPSEVLLTVRFIHDALDAPACALRLRRLRGNAQHVLGVHVECSRSAASRGSQEASHQKTAEPDDEVDPANLRELRSARRELQQNEERFALAMSGANVGLWDYDLESGEIVYSRHMLVMLERAGGASRGVSTPWSWFIHADDRARAEHTLRLCFEGKLELYEDEFRLCDSDRVVLSRGFVQHRAPGCPRRFVGTLVDVTELKRAQASLERAVSDLSRSNRELEQFAYVASHDLQEPLRMVASFTQLLAERYRGRLDAKADKYIDYAVDGARRMQGLINDLLALSRVGAQPRPEEIDAADLLSEVIRSHQSTIEDSQAVISVGPLPNLFADRVQMVQLFQNLIGNALKFRGEEPPRVSVTATVEGVGRCGRRAGGRPGFATFTVEDNGIGIEAAYIERIFVIFQRLHERGTYPGSGIGLAIAKKIVERHLGRIWVESEPGRGSRFRFMLPVVDGSSEL